MRESAEKTPSLRSVPRPIAVDAPGVDRETGRGGRPGDDDEVRHFDLHYVRSGPRGGADPVLVLPGGPGLASVLPYAGFRRLAVARGVDVLMVEHRGVGLSRRDRRGRDLPKTAMRVEDVVDDLVAVLDAEGIERVVVVGSSYGTYLAQALAVSHPGRVSAVVLDSPMLSARDEPSVRAYTRALLYDGTVGDPDDRALAARVRDVLGDHENGDGAEDADDAQRLAGFLRIVYEFGGPALLGRFLDRIRDGRAHATIGLLARTESAELETGSPYIMEFDLVGELAFRELAYGVPGDGGLFDETGVFTRLADRFSPYDDEPFDFPRELPAVDVPVVAVVGDRDLRTPRPTAERIADLAPKGVVVILAKHGHSALDLHSTALLEVIDRVHEAVRTGDTGGLEGLGTELASRLGSGRRTGGGSRLLRPLLAAMLAIDGVLIAAGAFASKTLKGVAS